MKIFAFADEASPMIDGQITAMKRNGLRGLEVRGVDNVNVADITLEKAWEVREKLDAAGLEVWTVGSPIGKIHVETDDFGRHLEKFCHTLRVAQILGAKNIRLFSFYIPAGQEAARYREEVIRRLRLFVEVARDTGIDLCHENEKGIYGDTAPRCLELLEAVPELKGIFDPANFIQCGQDTLEAWKLLRDHTKYMHIKDALPNGRVVPAGQGVGHLAEILADFASFGNELTIEPHLKVFSGLKGLERAEEAGQVGQLAYPNSDAAFDAACAALRALL